MANLATLKPWKPGQSGNPKGRPVGSKSTDTLLLEALQTGNLSLLDPLLAKLPKGEAKTRQELVAEAIIHRAIGGSDRLLFALWKYLDGAPPKWSPPPREPNYSLTELISMASAQKP